MAANPAQKIREWWSQSDGLQKYLVLSVLIHGSFILSFFVSSLFAPPEPKEYKVTMIKLSQGDGGTNLKRNLPDAKGLPQNTMREQKHALKELAKDKTGTDLQSHQSTTKTQVKTQKTSQKTRTAENGGVALEKKKDLTPPKKQETDISDALARIDQQLNQREIKLEAAQTKKGPTGQSEWGGDEGTEIDPALLNYYNAIKRKINKEWSFSKGEYAGPLKAKIVVLIDAQGNIIRTSFESNSGNGSFDASAMRAVRNSAPFPSPPAGVRDEAVTEGFIIEFNPQSVSGRM